MASVAYLSLAETVQLSQSSLLDTLPPLAQSFSQSLSQPPLGSDSPSGSAPHTSNHHYLSTFLSALTPFCTSHPNFFAPHLVSLLTFLPALILPPVYYGPTLTLGWPFPGNGGISNGWQGIRFSTPLGVFSIYLMHLICPGNRCVWLAATESHSPQWWRRQIILSWVEDVVNSDSDGLDASAVCPLTFRIQVIVYWNLLSVQGPSSFALC